MKVLDLILKNKWYKMIEAGIKKEEYRTIKPYWEKRLLNYKALVKYYEENYEEIIIKRFFFPYRPPIEHICEAFPRGYDAVRFHDGYTNRTILFECLNIDIGIGKAEWGAPKEDVFIISLGKQIK